MNTCVGTPVLTMSINMTLADASSLRLWGNTRGWEKKKVRIVLVCVFVCLFYDSIIRSQWGRKKAPTILNQFLAVKGWHFTGSAGHKPVSSHKLHQENYQISLRNNLTTTGKVSLPCQNPTPHPGTCRICEAWNPTWNSNERQTWGI